jgi:regulator of cell morphogenesis and NO signaling
MPAIAHHLATITGVHGERHPELQRVAGCFGQMCDELGQHMMKEERVLFPYLNEMAAARHAGVARSPFGTVANPIRMMEREHSDAGSSLRVLRELTHGYAMPPDGCTTYAVTMRELQEFERDLHRHIHLENDILFPAAIRLERGRGADEV